MQVTDYFSNSPEDADEDAVWQILRLRYWQHILNERLKSGAFQVPVHLAIGHEALAVAVDRCMLDNDRLCLSHRNVAYNLARSKSLKRLIDHFNLNARTRVGAAMGSMNLAMPETGIAYTSSILGNQLGVAAGISFNRRLGKLPGVVYAVIGDGAIEEGIFWESLVFCKSHSIPLVIIIENNDYSLASTISQRRCIIDTQRVCESVGISFEGVDGSSFNECYTALNRARETASAGSPACLEAKLSTFCQHAGATPGWVGDPLNISLSNGLVVSQTEDDPVYRLKTMVGELRFDQLAEALINVGANG